METNTSTFKRPTPEEMREMFHRAKARQQQLEKEGRKMWEELQSLSPGIIPMPKTFLISLTKKLQCSTL